MRKYPATILLLTLVLFGASSGTSQESTQSIDDQGIPSNDPLVYALRFARKTNEQYLMGQIAIRYAAWGNFEQAMRVVESLSDEYWKTDAFSEIAVEYWKHGEKEKARQLLLRVAGMPVPKDVIHIWGSVMENMAKAQQFDLALDVADSMEPSNASTTSGGLQSVIDELTQAKTTNSNQANVLGRVLAIAKTLREQGEEGSVLKKVAVLHATRGDFDSALKIVNGFKDDYDREDGMHDVAIQLAKQGQFARASQLADRAGDYFGPIAQVEIVTEAVKRKENAKALEVAAKVYSRIEKAAKEAEEPTESNASRLTELAIVYSDLGEIVRAREAANLAFTIAKRIGKPGERYPALKAVAGAYGKLGLYDRAIGVASALGDYAQLDVGTLADSAVEAQAMGRPDDVLKLMKAIQTTPLKDHEEVRLKAVVVVGRAMAKSGRLEEARKVLLSMASLADRLESNEQTPEILKDYAVALAETGDLHKALLGVPKIDSFFHVIEALIEIGSTIHDSRAAWSEGDLKLLNEIVGVKLPKSIEPRKLTKEAGWEIPGLARSTKLRPPELQKTRDRSIDLYVTFYEPELETLIKRPYESRRKREADQTHWKSEGLKIQLIEEQVINGHIFCYAVRVEEYFLDESQKRRYSNDLETLWYYDEDGDGKFETLEEGLGYFSGGHIPDWVFHNR
jgi:tetratricopeptide (TPR) repeat protein